MSNRIGDLYSCTDPNCGCEVEIQRPCGASSPDEEVSEIGTGSVRRSEFRSEPVSTTGDFGDQGATGEGTFGGSGLGDRSATASGRYDTESTRLREGTGNGGRTLTCFCGSEMHEVGASRRARATGAAFPTK